MANTKLTLLDAMVAELAATDGITTATRDLLTPADQRASAPYVGVISTGETVQVEDSTHIRYALAVDLVLVQAEDTIEELIDIVRDAVLSGAMATTIGAKEIRMLGLQATNLVNADGYSSSRMQIQIIYASAKAGA